MLLSKASEYGIKATIFIASKALMDTNTNLNEVSESIGSPIAYTAKILQDLVKHNILKSIRGARGGFTINKQDLEELNLLSIVICIDGPSSLTRCILGLKNCSSTNPCPLHTNYSEIREKTILMFQKSKVKDLAKELNKKTIVLIN